MDSRIERGARGGPTNRGRTKVKTASGRMHQVFGWSAPLHEYDVSHGVRGAADMETLRALWLVVNFTPYQGFRFRDWADYQVQASAGIVQANGTPTGQLYKRYTFAGIAFDRKISKPVAGTVSISNGASVLVSGAHYSLDTSSGAITWSATASAGVSGVTVGASTVVTLGSALAGLGVGDKLYLSGLTGADAALLNGQAWAVSAVVGAAYTLAVNTTGKTITAAGTGATYPGGDTSDALSWSGQFDVPVTFTDDEWVSQIEAMAGGGAVVTTPTIKLEEVRL